MGEQKIAAAPITHHAIGVSFNFDGSFVAMNLGNLLIEFLRNDCDQAAAGKHPDNAFDTRGK